jgi:hypothetical protein
MWNTIRDLLNSKKAMMAFISAAVWAVGKAGFHVETNVMLGVVSPLWGYIFGQAVTDIGKSAKQEELKASDGDAAVASTEDADTEPGE